MKIIGAIFASLIFLIIFSSEKHDSTATAAQEQPTPARSKPKHAAKRRSKASGVCRTDISKMTYRVIKQIDETHYWLESESNHTGSGHIEMETPRSLPIGETVSFAEATYLDTKGHLSNMTVYWREGCSAEEKAATDFKQGTWWTPVDPSNPSGPPCVNAVTAKYNFAPATIIQASDGKCFVTDGSSARSHLFVDCTDSALGVKLVYTRTRKECLKFASLTQTFVNVRNGQTNE